MAGVLDATAGVVVYFFFFSYNPLQVLQYIASGVFGPAALGGGFPMVLAGPGLHFLIAFVVAGLFYGAYSRLRVLRCYPVAAGLLYGLGIWLVMNLLVLPASDVPKGLLVLGPAVVGILWHMVLMGLPIALITARRFAAARG